MILLASLFRFIFIFLIVCGGLLMFYPAICHLFSSGLVYEPAIAGLTIFAVGSVGFIFVEILMEMMS